MFFPRQTGCIRNYSSILNARSVQSVFHQQGGSHCSGLVLGTSRPSRPVGIMLPRSWEHHWLWKDRNDAVRDMNTVSRSMLHKMAGSWFRVPSRTAATSVSAPFSSLSLSLRCFLSNILSPLEIVPIPRLLFLQVFNQVLGVTIRGHDHWINPLNYLTWIQAAGEII